MPTHVPAQTRDHLATPCGLLFNELLKSPKVRGVIHGRHQDDALAFHTFERRFSRREARDSSDTCPIVELSTG